MVAIHPRGLLFVAVAILILLAMDWFDIDWRVGLLAISIDALGPHPTGAGGLGTYATD